LKWPGATNPRRTAALDIWRRDYLYQIPFAGPPGHFKRISYVAVLNEQYPPDFFNGKLVLVGATAPGLRDEFPTPVSGQASAMPGIEIHANVLQGLREGIDIRLANSTQTGVVAILMLLTAMLAYLWLSPRRAMVLTAALVGFALLTSAFLFRFNFWWISPVVPILLLLLAYPLWSWRKLEATQRFFDAELVRLEREPNVVPQEAARRISPQKKDRVFVPDVIENRIVAMRNATERMRNLNRFVADSLESVPEAVLVTDANARVLFANSSAERMFASMSKKSDGVPAPAKLAESELFRILALLRHGDSRTWTDIWTQAYEETKTVSLEASGPAEFEFLVQIAPSFSARGVRTGSIVTLVDVSPLRESERRRDEALRFLSHDMRSPQASILTLLEMQRDDPSLMPIERLVDRIGKYSRRTLNLADDFLRLAKAERSKPQDFALLELHELVRDAAEEAWSLASPKKIRVTIGGDEHNAWVMGERDLITRALINLLSNAIKYSPPETKVTILLTREGNYWLLSVIDQGYGIAPADMSKLFTRFTRLKTEGQPEEDGIGLGLVFVKTVVERHHGSVKVSSKVASPGQEGTPGARGTTFTMTLPAVDPPSGD
ncbi:MAG: ATP-binding protein, partial [Usitatibacteraceae bacterium]